MNVNGSKKLQSGDRDIADSRVAIDFWEGPVQNGWSMEEEVRVGSRKGGGGRFSRVINQDNSLMILRDL